MPGLPNVSAADVDRYLELHGRTARSLLVAFMMLGDAGILSEALALDPGDPALLVAGLRFSWRRSEGEPPDGLFRDEEDFLQLLESGDPENRLVDLVRLTRLMESDAVEEDQLARLLGDLAVSGHVEDYESELVDLEISFYKEVLGLSTRDGLVRHGRAGSIGRAHSWLSRFSQALWQYSRRQGGGTGGTVAGGGLERAGSAVFERLAESEGDLGDRIGMLHRKKLYVAEGSGSAAEISGEIERLNQLMRSKEELLAVGTEEQIEHYYADWLAFGEQVAIERWRRAPGQQ